jgi:hypothetical protein
VVEAGGVDGEVEITVLAGLPAGQRGHTPAAADPVPHTSLVERVQHRDDVPHAHPPRLASGSTVVVMMVRCLRLC